RGGRAEGSGTTRLPLRPRAGRPDPRGRRALRRQDAPGHDGVPAVPHRSPRFLTAGTSAECAGRDPMPRPGEVSAPETDRADALAVVRAHDRGMVGAATDLRRRAALDILALQTIGEAGERAVERAEELHGCVPFGSVRHEPSGPGSQVPTGSLPPVITRGTADGQDFCHHWLAASQ